MRCLNHLLPCSNNLSTGSFPLSFGLLVAVMSGWDDDGPTTPSAVPSSSSHAQQQGLSDSQLSELSENISIALKKLKDSCALVGTSKDSAKLRAGIKSSREQLKVQLQRAATECSSSKTMAPIQQQVMHFIMAYDETCSYVAFSQKLLRSLGDMQKEFDSVVVETQRKVPFTSASYNTANR